MHSEYSKIREKIFSSSSFNIDEVAIEVFHLQYQHNPVYQKFCNLLSINPNSINSVHQIPFLPIELYKSHAVLCNNATPQKIFESSGTTGQITSKHYVADLSLYEESFITAFKQFYGDIKEWTILALLPSYLERDNSSLVYMVNRLIELSQSEHSGFYLNNLAELADKLVVLNAQQTPKKVLLIGVTFALLDFAEHYPMDLSEYVIMETGGMKGRREELTKDEVHHILKQAFHVTTIHSEYGMTELLSQAYSKKSGIFESPRWMKVLRRDMYNPLLISDTVGRGGLNCIDLANLYSCSFIATEDAVELLPEGKFRVTGRLDYADLRGCNLMVADM